MNKTRANLGFSEALDDFNSEEWPTKRKKRKSAQDILSSDSNKEEKTLTRDQVITQAAIVAGFQSREPSALSQNIQKEKLPLRRRRTGRNTQFNLKARPETITAFCNIADQQGWGLGETLEKAVELLESKYWKDNERKII